MMLQALHTNTETCAHTGGERFQISNNSPSPEKLITDTSCQKLDIIKGVNREGKQLGSSIEIHFQV